MFIYGICRKLPRPEARVNLTKRSIVLPRRKLTPISHPWTGIATGHSCRWDLTTPRCVYTRLLLSYISKVGCTKWGSFWPIIIIASVIASDTYPFQNRVRFLRRVSLRTGNGSLLPVWTTLSVSGTSRTNKGVCNTSTGVRFNLSCSYLNSFGIGICLDLDWLDEELFASCSADKVIQVLSVNHPEPIAVLTLVLVLSVHILQTFTTYIGDMKARSTKSKQTHREPGSCRVLMI